MFAIVLLDLMLSFKVKSALDTYVLCKTKIKLKAKYINRNYYHYYFVPFIEIKMKHPHLLIFYGFIVNGKRQTVHTGPSSKPLFEPELLDLLLFQSFSRYNLVRCFFFFFFSFHLIRRATCPQWLLIRQLSLFPSLPLIS